MNAAVLSFLDAHKDSPLVFVSTRGYIEVSKKLMRLSEGKNVLLNVDASGDVRFRFTDHEGKPHSRGAFRVEKKWAAQLARQYCPPEASKAHHVTQSFRVEYRDDGYYHLLVPEH